ncbi:hypothetical protein BDQ17DRAFT_1361396 [Cyathus striatus]|nr:hypothetical protein BDQ17DRAFT_1361396 [Cyathus striatus]
MSATPVAPNGLTLPPIPGFGEFKASSLLHQTFTTHKNIFAIDTYYLAFPKDRLQIKLLVYFILAIQTAQTLICTRDAFIIFAKSFGNVVVLDSVHTLWLSYPIMGGIVGWLYQCFSGYRIYQSSVQYKVGAGVICLLSTFGMVAAIVFGVHMQKAGAIRFTVSETSNVVWYGLWNAASALCDAFITAIMLYKLLRKRESEENGLLVNRIIRLLVETGIITAFAAITSIVVFLGYRRTPLVSSYFLVPGLILGKLYGITLLAALNSRLEVVGGRHSDSPNTSDQKVAFPGFRTRRAHPDNSTPPPILVETHRSVWVDESNPDPAHDVRDGKKVMRTGSDIDSINGIQ